MLQISRIDPIFTSFTKPRHQILVFTEIQEWSKVLIFDCSINLHEILYSNWPRWIVWLTRVVDRNNHTRNSLQPGGYGMMPACATMDRNATFVHDDSPNSIDVHPTDHDLTVIIPAYNEEKRLPWTLEQLTRYLAAWGIDYRVLVADDGSADCTAALSEKFGPRCSTMSMARQGGKGRAVRCAMIRATGRIVAFTDADLPFDLAALKNGYELLDRGACRVVFGARDLAASASRVKRHVMRSMATYIFRKIVKMLISSPVADTQCGLKLFERRAALEIFSRTAIDGFAFDAEVVQLTHRLNYAFERIPVTLINDYDTTISLRRNALPMLADVFGLWLRTHFGGQTALPQLNFVGTAEASKSGPPRKAA
jgi:dolichyl-phosphate beta-glucosyltransferase